MKDAPRTLLLVEDNEDDAFLTTRAIKEAGITHHIQHCHDGQSVITYLQETLAGQHPFPDLVLLDLKIPRLSGLKTLEWIRSQNAFRSLVVVALTSSNEPRDVATAYRLHINAYLVKPSSLREMVDLASSIRGFWLDQKHFIPPPLP
jgi:CheY-like chemotaxis protein